jgi:hypothetical protein
MSNKYKNSEDVPTEMLVNRLKELVNALVDRPIGEIWSSEFTMRIPAELDRDADLVMSELGRRLLQVTTERDALQAEVSLLKKDSYALHRENAALWEYLTPNEQACFFKGKNDE